MDFALRREQLIKETKENLVSSITDDYQITQAISAITELDRSANILVSRFREWYGLFYPERLRTFSDHEALIEKVLSTERSNADSMMGADFSDEDITALFGLAEDIQRLYKQKGSLTEYIRVKMQSFCPDVLAICGPLIGAKLLAHKGTLKELAFMPASTI